MDHKLAEAEAMSDSPQRVDLLTSIASELAGAEPGQYTMDQVRRFEALGGDQGEEVGADFEIADFIEEVLDSDADPRIKALASELKDARDPTSPYQTKSAPLMIRVRQLLGAALDITQGDERFDASKQYIVEALQVCPPA